MDSWSVEEVCRFIEEKGFENDVIELFRANRIRGQVLSMLTDAELKELGVTALGDRKILLKLFQRASDFENSNDKVLYTYIERFVKGVIQGRWRSSYVERW